MLTFQQFLSDVASKGEAVNTLFEERIFELVGVLHRIADVLASEHIAYEVVGGLAVLIHVEEVRPELTALTRDVDLMIRRQDLERIKQASEQHGFRFRHAAGVDMLLYGGEDRSSRNAVHLVFSEELVRPHYPSQTPPIAPQAKSIHGKDVMVIPIADLVRMKLTSFRLKDQVHIQTLDAAGLIEPTVEESLPAELRLRLTQIRASE